MRTVRLLGFTLAILLGIAAGLISGWLYFPSEISTTTPENLRADYKADYVLMVAEVYATDGDLENAIALLNEIKPGDPLGAVQRGLLTAQEMGYADWEMRLIADLEISLQQKLSQGAGQ